MIKRPTGFENLIPELEKIYRFSMFDVFRYRFNLWQHERRVAYMVKDLSPAVKKTLPKFDERKAFTLALVHDDAETIIGDIQRGHKIFMTKKQLTKLDEGEEKAVATLAKRFP